MMKFQLGLFVSAVIVICGQTTAILLDNAPKDPLWPLFAARLSNTTGRDVAVINALGLSDSTIKTVWNEYKRHMPTLVVAALKKPTTTLPPMPDLYQSAYSFSSSQTQRQAQKLQEQQRFDQANAVVGQILALVKQTTPKPVSVNNVLPTNNLQSMSNADLLLMYAKLKDMNSRPAASARNNMIAKLQALNSALPPQTPNNMLTDAYSYSGQSLAGPRQISYQVAPATTTTSTTTPKPEPAPTSASLGQLIQMYQQMYNSAPSTTAAAPTTTTTKQDAFDAQLKQFFPQFNNIALPTEAAQTAVAPAASNATATSNATAPAAANATKANTEQMIFDALLFGPNPSPTNTAANSVNSVNAALPATLAPLPATTTPLPAFKLPSAFDIFGGSSAAKKVGPSGYMENVIRTRASRELGCRFMTELIGVEIQHDLPMGVDCTGKCIFPRVKAIRNGPFCVCCPIYINENSITLMSMMKRFNYISEGPFRVMS